MADRFKHNATEQLSFDKALARMQDEDGWMKTVVGRLNSIRPLRKGEKILDIGSAQGRFLICLSKLGFKAVGVEPWAQARDVAKQLAEHEGVEIEVHEGVGEELPLSANEFDAVLISSVLEHVSDPQAVLSESYRVLKPGGVIWFSTASSICPRQSEIGVFPFFGWYPNSLKLRIMEWAKTKKPHLVGHTERPAIHWFTPWKAHRMLRQAGFKNKIYDRWDIRMPSEGGFGYRQVLRIIKLNAVTKFVTDILCKSCAYATIK